MLSPPDDLLHAPEVTFLRSQIERTARESQLRLELVSSEYESRLEQCACDYEANIQLLRREQDTKLVLVKRECETKVETLKCQLESSRCQYETRMAMYRRECEEMVRWLERDKKDVKTGRIKAEVEGMVERKAELKKVQVERDECIAAAKNKDAELQALQYVILLLFI